MRSASDLAFAEVRVGHWTDHAARTGCTVVLLPEGTVAGCELGGGAPATRELALLEPGCTVGHADAVVLTGGSAFCLGAADGVMGFLEAQGRGFATQAGPVPIVPTMAVYDLGVGDARVRPGPAQGAEACRTARPWPPATGPVGAGTGATVGNWRGPGHIGPGGVGAASVLEGNVAVAALVVVNAYGDVVAAGQDPPMGGLMRPEPPVPGAHTVIGVVLTNATLDKLGCRTVARGAHDGLARAVHPPHTAADGDAFVAVATGPVTASADQVRALAVGVVAESIRSAVAG